MIEQTALLFVTFAATVFFFGCFWIVHIIKKDAGVADLYWGPGFAAIAILCIWLSHSVTPEKLILAYTTILWSVRLGWHMSRRHFSSDAEDRRYAAMRAKAGGAFWWRSLFTVFLLQAVLMWLIATPQHIGLTQGVPLPDTAARIAFYGGLLVFIAGFLFETVADLQLARFKAEPANAGKTMTEGLWAYSRHPNYFGETVLWWGFGLMAYALNNTPVAFAGPAILTFLILKVSGVALLERHLISQKEGYADYIRTTSAFIPRPRSKSG